MPAKGWRKEDSKEMNLHVRFGECQSKILESLMLKFGYENKSKFIWDLLYECWEYNINIPVNHAGNEHRQNLKLSELKFFPHF